MSNRLTVQSILENAMTACGMTVHVYYQPPESVKLIYPCIVYSRERFSTRFANDNRYIDKTQYTITAMDKDPESELVEVLRNLPYCEMDRELVSDNIHNFIFTFYH